MEVIATLDEILAETYRKGLDAYLTYAAHIDDPNLTHLDLSKLHDVSPNTVKSWIYEERSPRPYQFVDWAINNDFLSDVEDCKTGLGITMQSPRYSQLEKLAFLIWSTGNLTARYVPSLSGGLEQLTEVAENLNMQLATKFEPYEAQDLGYKLPFDANIGRLVWGFLRYTGGKFGNDFDIPEVVKSNKQSKRNFVKTLNETRGFLTNSHKTAVDFWISLPNKRDKESALLLGKKIKEIIFDVTGIAAKVAVSKQDEHAFGGVIRPPSATEYLYQSNLNL